MAFTWYISKILYDMINVHIHKTVLKEYCHVIVSKNSNIMVLSVEVELKKTLTIHLLLRIMHHDLRTYAKTRPTIPHHRYKHTHKNTRSCEDMLCLSASSDSLLTTAVAKMAAMPACCGRSWISECRAAG